MIKYINLTFLNAKGGEKKCLDGSGNFSSESENGILVPDRVPHSNLYFRKQINLSFAGQKVYTTHSFTRTKSY